MFLTVLTHLTKRERTLQPTGAVRQVFLDRQTGPDDGGSDVELPRTARRNNRHGLHTRISDFSAVRVPRIEVEIVLPLGLTRSKARRYS